MQWAFFDKLRRGSFAQIVLPADDDFLSLGGHLLELAAVLFDGLPGHFLGQQSADVQALDEFQHAGFAVADDVRSALGV